MLSPQTTLPRAVGQRATPLCQNGFPRPHPALAGLERRRIPARNAILRRANTASCAGIALHPSWQHAAKHGSTCQCTACNSSSSGSISCSSNAVRLHKCSSSRGSQQRTSALNKSTHAVTQALDVVLGRQSPDRDAEDHEASVESVATTQQAADSTSTMQQGTSAAAVAADTQQQPSVAAADGKGWWRRRWTMVLLCFVAFMLCNMDRVNMAVAILPMREQYGWDSATVGAVQASFFWGYLMTQVLGGVWAHKYGGKLVLGMGVLWWSVATALTPMAAQAGLPVLMAARALMGVGEGVAMPAMNSLLSKWVPAVERSRSLALVYSGMFLGSMTGLTLSPHIIQTYGWPSVFWSFGLLGIVWLAAWVTRAAASPSQDPHISQEELHFITANTGVAAMATTASGGADKVHAHGGHHGGDLSGVQNIPWKALLSRKEVWAIIVCHFCHNWGTFILLTWMPTYYSQVLHLDLASSALLSCLPWATMAVAANVGGWLADTAVAKGTNVTTVRKVMQTIGFMGPALFLSVLSSVTTVPAAVACMMGAQGCDAFSQSGLYSNHQDIAPRYAGVLLGISNTAGVLAGVAGSLATGYILQHGTWSQVWQVAIGFYLLGTVIWNAFATGERIFD